MGTLRPKYLLYGYMEPLGSPLRRKGLTGAGLGPGIGSGLPYIGFYI